MRRGPVVWCALGSLKRISAIQLIPGQLLVGAWIAPWKPTSFGSSGAQRRLNDREQMEHAHYYDVIVHRPVMIVHVPSVPNAICLPPIS